MSSPFDPVLFGVELVEHADLDVDGDAPDARELGAQPLVQQKLPEKWQIERECKVIWICDQRSTWFGERTWTRWFCTVSGGTLGAVISPREYVYGQKLNSGVQIRSLYWLKKYLILCPYFISLNHSLPHVCLLNASICAACQCMVKESYQVC